MPKATPARSRGRPAKLSRDQILSCALKLIERSPGQKITMTGVAKALNTAPMSLYTHVQHRDDLMDGIAERVMGRIDLQLNPQNPWQDRVRVWLQRCYEHLSAYPQVVSLLPQSDHIPPSWLRVHAPLILTLKDAGFTGQQLATASQWVGHQLIGALVMGFARKRSTNTQQEVSDLLSQLDSSQQSAFADILPYLTPDTELFAYTVEQVVLALEARLSQ
ncbi:TetR/AcrR family transcriptional regulator [Litorivivens sp.]|uniref:TetR/AcrR family transcriptional regulator n=3 Tax=Litorivivens sp. TaxID=2020868 RepID=UPI0035648880